MEKETINKFKEVIEWVVCIIIALVIAILFRYYVGTPTIVQQKSMYPTLKPNQRLILNRLPVLMGKELKRGDIITFEAPSKLEVTTAEADLRYPVAEYNNDPKGLWSKFLYNVLEVTKVTFIKRVIGLPGEHIEIKENKVYINGEEYKEPYLGSDVVTTALDGPYTDFIVPEGCVFAMGDNRMHSKDCRAFGCIPMSRVEGKVVLRFWPLNTWGNPAKY